MRDLVREGRWEIVGGWLEQPDCNLPSDESFLRQALNARAFFNREFGPAAAPCCKNRDMERRPTIKDIAGVCGVHHATVSRALRGNPCVAPATLARINAAAKELGYEPDPMMSALAACSENHPGTSSNNRPLTGGSANMSSPARSISVPLP